MRKTSPVTATLIVVLLLVGFVSGMMALYPSRFADDRLDMVIVPTDEPSALVGGYQLPVPVKRMVHPDNTCAGVVRSDGSADGECPPESANLPTIQFKEVLSFEGQPVD